MSEPQAAPAVVVPAVPPELQRYLLPLGKNSRSFHAMWFGGDKTGKSYNLAHYPSPKVCIDGALGRGLAPLLDPASGDRAFTLEEADAIIDCVQWVLRTKEDWASLVIDDASIMYSSWQDEWAEKNLDPGEEIRGGNWRRVKGPWNRMMRDLDLAPLHIGFGARLKDTLWTEGDGKDPAPGEEPSKKLVIKQIVAPYCERNMPYAIDMQFYCEQLVDSKYRPVPQHRVTFFKGRVPRALAGKLRLGTKWDFKDADRENTWNRIVKPWLPEWEANGVELLGVDPTELRYAKQTFEDASQDQEFGAVMALINADYAGLTEYRAAWQKEIGPRIDGLRGSRNEQAQAAHKQRRAELEAKAKEGAA